jgi:hypothetical protein
MNAGAKYFFPLAKVPTGASAGPFAGARFMTAATAHGRPRIPAFIAKDDAEQALAICRDGGGLGYVIGDELAYEVSSYPRDDVVASDVIECHPCVVAHAIGSFVCDVCVMDDSNIVVVTSWSIERHARSIT